MLYQAEEDRLDFLLSKEYFVKFCVNLERLYILKNGTIFIVRKNAFRELALYLSFVLIVSSSGHCLPLNRAKPD